MRTFKRTEISGAPYNPRRIDEAAKKRLRNGLKRVGLLEPPVVNIRDGRNRIVSGHQRIAILDSLEHGQEYLIDCAIVDLDDKNEKEVVILLNNDQAMGNWDIGLLDSLLKNEDLSFLNCGFDEAFLKVALPSWEPPIAPAATQQEEAVIKTAQEIEAAAEAERKRIELIKQQKKQGIQAADANRPEDADAEFYVVAVFRNHNDTDRFLDRLRVDRREKYISGNMLLEALDGQAPTPGTETWVPLSAILGTSRVPQPVADTLERAVSKMRAAGDLGEKNAFQALEYLAVEYLNDPNH